jgi:hypothetical protein
MRGPEQVVLCLGPSHTLGLGARRGQSYPEHLQKLFEGHRDEFPSVRVVNEGVNAINTAEMLETLPTKLDYYRPSLVILQLGESNFWNRTKYERYRNRRPEGFFSSLRVMRMFHYLLYQEREQRQLRERREDAERSVTVLKTGSIHRDLFKAGWDTCQKSREGFLKPSRAKDRAEASALLSKLDAALGSDPEAALFIACLQEDFFGDREKALHWWLWAIEHSVEEERDYRRHRMGWAGIPYEKIIKLARNLPLGSPAQKEWAEFLDRIRVKDPKQHLRLTDIASNDIIRWVRDDLIEIVRAIQERGIPVIFQNFPPRPEKGAVRFANTYLPAIFGEFPPGSAAWFDQQAYLEGEWKKRGEPRASYFSSDLGRVGDHLGSKGYSAVARGLFEMIRESAALSASLRR